MDLFEALAGRRSVRGFKPDPVPEADIRKIIEAATLAPNGSNAQPWRFIVVTDPDKIQEIKRVVDDKLAALSDQKTVSSMGNEGRNFVNLFAWAPAVIFVFQTPYESHTDKMLEAKAPEVVADRKLVVNTALQSVAAATACLTLAAHAMGYGTCWMTAPLLARREIQNYLETPPEHNLIAVMPLGVPEGNYPKVNRKPVDDVLEIR